MILENYYSGQSQDYQLQSSGMTTMRTYGDGCGIAHALDLVGERWALLVIRELLLGPKRFVDLRAGLPGASPNVLSQRLRELQRAGVVTRGTLPPPAGSRIYQLTDWGRELDGIVIALGRWAARSPSQPRDPMGIDSIVLALRALFDPGAATGLHASYELRLGEHRFHVDVADAALTAARGAAQHPDATITTDPETLQAVLWQGLRLTAAQRTGQLTIEGDKAAAERFVRLFPLPQPAQPGPAA
jgi:DNA-binding HxlR family transcriptional regulator/putative sterol carrier protein